MPEQVGVGASETEAGGIQARNAARPAHHDEVSLPGRHRQGLARQPQGRDPVVAAVGRPPWVLVPGLNAQPERDQGYRPGAGLELPVRLSFETWLRIGQQLSAVARSSAWYLGDWLAYGQAAYTGRYRGAIEQTSLDYQTLRNYAWVARRFPLSRRRDGLSFGHHAEVAALPEPEQDFWLRKAGELGWSRNHLRREVHGSLRERRAAPDIPRPGQLAPPITEGQAEERPECTILITLTSDELELCHRAAAAQHMTIQAWAGSTLEHAARRSRAQPGCADPHS